MKLCSFCGARRPRGRLCNTPECRARRVPVERPAANGEYVGAARVRTVPPGMSGEEARHERWGEVVRGKNRARRR